MQDIKRCSRCKQTKPVTEFHPSKRNHYHSYCKPCLTDYCRERRQANPGPINKRLREYTKEKKYGIPYKKYQKIIARGCEMCGSHDRVGLDHCHKTGKNRGPLCRQHNLGLANFNDSIPELKAAIRYLRDHVD